MKLIEAIRAVNDIASSQRGLFTSAQAKALGVERYALSRLEGLGNIERLAKGVYRMGGSPSTREEGVLAARLSIDPGKRPGDEALAHGGGPDRLQGGPESGRERARGRARKGPHRRRGSLETIGRCKGSKSRDAGGGQPVRFVS